MIPKTIDIFCEIIDNYGDIGVVYRLAKEIKREYKETKVRVILNRLDEFIEINPKIKKLNYQEINQIVYIKKEFFKKNLIFFGVSDIIIEAFGCNIFAEYIDIAKTHSKLWINLEYLSGEKWIEEFHLKESLIDSKYLKKFFYMPGFSKKSGGLLIDKSFLEKRNYVRKNRNLILKKYFPEIDFQEKFIVTIFSYEKNFEKLLDDIKQSEKNFVLLLMGEKTKKSFAKILDEKATEHFGNYLKYDKIIIKNMEFLSQEEYEEIISATDFNLVRGEDSIVRALILGKPFIWHVYPQKDNLHIEKLKAFIERFKEAMKFSRREAKIFELYEKLLINYNEKDENYLDLFENFSEINIICEKYSKFLIEECNLIKKLKKYIKDFKGG